MKENAALRSQASQRECAIDVAVLYASPRYNLDGNLLQKTSGLSEETKVVKSVLKKSGQAIKYQKLQATAGSFRETLVKQPKILHISI